MTSLPERSWHTAANRDRVEQARAHQWLDFLQGVSTRLSAPQRAGSGGRRPATSIARVDRTSSRGGYDRAMEPFEERMRHWGVRNRLDLIDLKYPQVGEPTV